MISEFDLIARFFTRPAGREDVVLGVGDDAAIVRPQQDAELLISVDTLVAGVHFTPDIDPSALGHKALAVNLSDMAAMGAEPAWATLALTMPEPDDRWLAGFCAGFFALADEFRVELIGGNMARGPLSITVQIHGYAAPGAAFRRSTARPGDLIFVTGTLGDAGLALLMMQEQGLCAPGELAVLRERLNRPRPRVHEALRLRGLIHAAIDLSDGLVADLGHVLAASGVGATLSLRDLPLSPAFRACLAASGAATSDALRSRMRGADTTFAWAELALGSGDDYELCFTAAPEQRSMLEAALKQTGCACIGVIEARPGLRCLFADGTSYAPSRAGWEHFR